MGTHLRGGDCLSVPRFETRFMKDSLNYRGTVLWNTICFNKDGISHLSNKDQNQIRTNNRILNLTLPPSQLRGIEMPILCTIDDLLVDNLVNILNILTTV